MANQEAVDRLRQGVSAWNDWRTQNHNDPWPPPAVDLREADLGDANLCGADLCGADLEGANLHKTDLREADLGGANLCGADLEGANLHKTDLREADLWKANLNGAFLREARLFGARLREVDLRGADLGGANLRLAKLSGADLSRAKLSRADLGQADLSRAKLSRAELEFAILIETKLTNADLTGCRVYGISAWDVKLKGAIQRNLVITTGDQPEITVDNLEVAQFIYLLLHNEKIRSVIDTITSKVVLILGRFTPERKTILDALRNILRDHDRTPVVFDFDVPSTKNVTDTVKLLAQLARYVIVDLSDPNSAPFELGVISMLGIDSTPVVPLIVSGQRPFPMLADVLQKRWSTELVTYQDLNDLITNLSEKLLKPAEAKLRELRGSSAPFP
jgi:uncharacterized protein YjbI with pentapeptide repeats